MTMTLGIALPPGPIDSTTFRSLLETAFGPRGWIRPTSFGPAEPDEHVLSAGDDAMEAVASCMRDEGGVCIAERGLGQMNVLADRHWLSYTGMLYLEGDWAHFVSRLAGASWAVAEVMALVGSPFAYAAATDAVEAYARRWIADEHGGQSSVATVLGGYKNGLQHPHWRMWFGVEWTDFIGRKVLAAAPALESREEGAGWFVQINEDPNDWQTSSGIEDAQRFAAALGKNVFYDPDQPDRPLVAPDFSHLMRSAMAKYPDLRERIPVRPPGSPSGR